MQESAITYDAVYKLGVKVAHVEAELRSFDRSIPEEINRLLTDAIADYLFVTEPSALQNLKNEGIPDEKVFFVGNLMIDTLTRSVQKDKWSTILKELELNEHEYVLVTLHRPENVDDPIILGRLLEIFRLMSRQLLVIFPAHPRTMRNILGLRLDCKMTESDQSVSFSSNERLRIIKPLDYFDFLKLMAAAKVVLTDSGGIQEETTFLEVPCLTLRENTERPITIEVGINTLVDNCQERILREFKRLMTTPSGPYQ